jgi:TRAP-type C4-dicarboxylate transport system permease small subunit
VRAAFLRLSDALATVTGVAVTLLMAAMTLDCVLGVFFRYVVQDALTWTEEFARYLMIWMGFLGMGLAVRTGGHVAVDLLVTRLPARLQRATLLVVQALVLTFLLAVVIAGWQLVDRVSGQLTPVLGVSMAWPYLAIPVGSLLMAIEIVAFAVRGPAAAAETAVAAFTRGHIG